MQVLVCAHSIYHVDPVISLFGKHKFGHVTYIKLMANTHWGVKEFPHPSHFLIKVNDTDALIPRYEKLLSKAQFYADDDPAGVPVLVQDNPGGAVPTFSYVRHRRREYALDINALPQRKLNDLENNRVCTVAKDVFDKIIVLDRFMSVYGRRENTPVHEYDPDMRNADDRQAMTDRRFKDRSRWSNKEYKDAVKEERAADKGLNGA